MNPRSSPKDEWQQQQDSLFRNESDDIITSYNLIVSSVCGSSCSELLNDHVEDFPEDDKVDIPTFNVPRAIALSKWLLLLLLAWLLTKIICFCGLPSNCDAGLETVDAMEDLQMLFVFGVTLGYMVGVVDPTRSAYVFDFKRRWWFFATFFCVGPVFSALGEIPALHHSITPGGGILIIMIAVLCAAFVMGWHLIYTWNMSSASSVNSISECSRADAMVYTISRLSVLVFYVLTVTIGCLLGNNDGKFTYHVHHYLVAYALAMFASYRHTLSLTILAIATGIFVQGLGAYKYASFFERRGVASIN